MNKNRFEEHELPYQTLKVTGKWNSKTTEDYIQMCKEKLQGDKNLQKDLLLMAGEWRNTVVKEIGRARYDALSKQLGDDLLDENDHYAVVHNASVGGTYEVFRKISKSQVQDTLTRYGLPSNATSDVKEVAAMMPELQKEEQEERHGMRR